MRSVFVLTIIFSLCAGTVWAHASEQGFVLLLPTDIYAAAGTLTVAASMLLVTLMPATMAARLFRPIRFGFAPPTATASQVTSVLSTWVLFCLIMIGFFGATDPQDNLLPLTIWTVWWIGLLTVQGTLFDVWRWINPWRALHRLLLPDHTPRLSLPATWQAWPAVLIFLAFQGFVLADPAPNDPTRLASFVLGYWVFAFAGMTLCGAKVWMRQAECFTIVFHLIGSLRPCKYSRIGLSGWASVTLAPLDASRATLCLMILASGSFDGLHETFWWLAQIDINPLEFPGRSAVILPSTLGLIAANAALIAIFVASLWIGLRLTRDAPSLSDAYRSFAIAILPIALGYHVAHYLVSFLVQSQYVLQLIGDPLGRGWNLFGLADRPVTTGFLNTSATVRTIWLSQAGVVVFSHVLSVIMAHHLAGRLTTGRRDMLLIQTGLSLLMIAYTIFGLWLLAAPRGV